MKNKNIKENIKENIIPALNFRIYSNWMRGNCPVIY